MFKLVIILASSVLLVAGCTNLGVGGFSPGITTEAEVRARLGTPGMVWNEPDGGRLLEFSGQPNGTYCHIISVGPDGRIRDILQAFSEENFRRVVPGLTQDQVRRLLGGPEEKVRYALKPDEEVWSWRYDETPDKISYFLAYFGLDRGLLRTGRFIFYKPSLANDTP